MTERQRRGFCRGVLSREGEEEKKQVEDLASVFGSAPDRSFPRRRIIQRLYQCFIRDERKGDRGRG